MAYTTSLKVRFGDVDHAGIAYYPTIIDYLHRGFEDFWEGWMQTPYREVVDDHKVGFPSVDLCIQFRSPLRYGDQVDLAMHVQRLGRSSVTFAYVLSTPTGGKPRVCAEATLTVVAVDMGTFTPIPVPSRYRRRLRACTAPARAGIRRSAPMRAANRGHTRT